MMDFRECLRFAGVVVLSGTLAVPGLAAQQAEEAAAESEEEQPAGQVEEVIVVTASRTEQLLHDVPAAVTVLTAREIEEIPADTYADIFRNVPGLNVAQMSARDIQITGRGATSSLATSELVLLDGRTLYLDFFGFVMWDFLPINSQEIKQIEVVRGPGSAVWGANAMSGVINLITKSPKEMQGTSLTAGGGEFSTAYASVTHAGARDRLGYKLSGGYYEQDSYRRPTGLIPGTNTPYPPFENQGTRQPKGDLRFDYDVSPDSTWTFAGGYAGTDGIIHTGIGPFDIESGSSLSYVKAGWARRAMRLGVFANFLDGDAQSLLTVGIDGRPLSFRFKTDTYNIDFSNSTALGQKNILTYGANARRNEFDLTIAPRGREREEFGVFLQDEILFGRRVRWVIGARWDDIDPIGSVVSPRTSFLISPRPNHTFRISYNRAFRAPSLINNFLETAILNLVVLPTGPFIFPSLAVGNIRLDEERLDAVEVGYVATWGNRTTFSASVYRNETKDSTDFFPAVFYTSANPPPGWPLPPIFLDFPPLAGRLPAAFTYRNIGEIVDRGVELAFNHRPSDRWSWFINYSYQDDPDVTGIPEGEVNLPPTHRANLGFAYDSGRFFVHGNANYWDEAFWTDVLDSRFWGPTEEETLVNLALGVRLARERVTLSVQGTNIFDEEIQQHVFGDILERKVVGQVHFRF